MVMRISTTIVFVYRKSDKDSCSVIEVYWQPRKNMASAEQISLYLYISISGILGPPPPPPPQPGLFYSMNLHQQLAPISCVIHLGLWMLVVRWRVRSQRGNGEMKEKAETHCHRSLRPSLFLHYLKGTAAGTAGFLLSCAHRRYRCRYRCPL